MEILAKIENCKSHIVNPLTMADQDVRVYTSLWGAAPDEFSLVIEITVAGCKFEFTLDEPAYTTAAEWKKFLDAKGEATLPLYSGSGGCISYIDKTATSYEFVNEQNGCGNGTNSKFTAPVEPLNSVLRNTIVNLITEGRIQ